MPDCKPNNNAVHANLQQPYIFLTQTTCLTIYPVFVPSDDRTITRGALAVVTTAFFSFPAGNEVGEPCSHRVSAFLLRDFEKHFLDCVLVVVSLVHLGGRYQHESGMVFVNQAKSNAQ